MAREHRGSWAEELEESGGEKKRKRRVVRKVAKERVRSGEAERDSLWQPPTIIACFAGSDSADKMPFRSLA